MVKVLITESKSKWGKEITRIIPRVQTEIYTKMLVEALTNQKVSEIKWDR